MKKLLCLMLTFLACIMLAFTSCEDDKTSSSSNNEAASSSNADESSIFPIEPEPTEEELKAAIVEKLNALNITIPDSNPDTETTFDPSQFLDIGKKYDLTFKVDSVSDDGYIIIDDGQMLLSAFEEDTYFVFKGTELYSVEYLIEDSYTTELVADFAEILNVDEEATDLNVLTKLFEFLNSYDAPDVTVDDITIEDDCCIINNSYIEKLILDFIDKVKGIEELEITSEDVSSLKMILPGLIQNSNLAVKIKADIDGVYGLDISVDANKDFCNVFEMDSESLKMNFVINLNESSITDFKLDVDAGDFSIDAFSNETGYSISVIEKNDIEETTLSLVVDSEKIELSVKMIDESFEMNLKFNTTYDFSKIDVDCFVNEKGVLIGYVTEETLAYADCKVTLKFSLDTNAMFGESYKKPVSASFKLEYADLEYKDLNGNDVLYDGEEIGLNNVELEITSLNTGKGTTDLEVNVVNGEESLKIDIYIEPDENYKSFTKKLSDEIINSLKTYPEYDENYILGLANAIYQKFGEGYYRIKIENDTYLILEINLNYYESGYGYVIVSNAQNYYDDYMEITVN